MFHTVGSSALTDRSLGADASDVANDADAGEGEKRKAMCTVSWRGLEHVSTSESNR